MPATVRPTAITTARLDAGHDARRFVARERNCAEKLGGWLIYIKRTAAGLGFADI
jgi:hypothetical protein